MKKRLFGTIVAAVLTVTTAVTAFASGSKTAGLAPVGDSVGKYIFTEITEEDFPELKEEHPEVLELILKINEGTATLEEIAEQAPELLEQLKNKALVAKFVDIKPTDAGLKAADGKYHVSMSVPALTETMTDVLVLHYSTVRSLWELITPSKVDAKNKELNVEFEDLSPVAVIANTNGQQSGGSTGGTPSSVNGGADSSVGTSPKTGAEYAWMGYAGAAAVLLGAAVYVFRRTKKNA